MINIWSLFGGRDSIREQGERESIERESGWEWDDQEGPTLALASVARATYTNAKSHGSPPL